MSDVQHQRPHCWECRRRRLVCDGTQPVCTKCRTAGIVCPGFADKQPLKWLAPGQVMSRARRKKGPRKANSKRPTMATPASTDSIEDSTSDQHTSHLDIVLPVELRPESCDVFEALTYCPLPTSPLSRRLSRLTANPMLAQTTLTSIRTWFNISSVQAPMSYRWFLWISRPPLCTLS
jgi:hypothetical protein